MIQILYFAQLREQVETAQEKIILPDSVHDLSSLRQYLSNRGEPWSIALAEDTPLMMSLNQTMAKAHSLVSDGDEVAFFPPVTGG